MCALLAALASMIARAYGQEGLVWPLRAAAAATFAETVYLTALGISTALGRTIVAVRLETAERLVEVSASVALVLAGAGAAGAVLGRAIGFGLAAVISALVVLIAARSGGLAFRPGLRGMPAGAAYGHVASVFATDRSPALTRSVSVLLLAAYSGPFASGIFMAPAALAGVGHYVGCVTANRVTPRLAKGCSAADERHAPGPDRLSVPHAGAGRRVGTADHRIAARNALCTIGRRPQGSGPLRVLRGTRAVSDIAASTAPTFRVDF